MIRHLPIRLRRRAARLAWLAAVAVVASVALAFVLSAVTGGVGGTVSDKQIVVVPRCHDRSLTCTSETCYQITYVTDNGERKLACVSSEDFDTLQVGDHYRR